MPQPPLPPRTTPLLRVQEAQAAIAAALQPVAGVCTIPAGDALGRVLAAAVVSALDVPAHDNAAMDGFAFDGAALRHGQSLQLRQAGSALAGRPFSGRAGAGDCVRIMTGAVLPAGLDTVVPLELCGGSSDGLVRIDPGTVRQGDHCRRRGEDLAAGHTALAAGRVLRPADLGLLASLGLAQLSVREPLRVALFSTGDEVVAPGQPLPPGGVYDSNRASLAGALQRLGMRVLDLGTVRDDPAALQATLETAAAHADVVLTSGGVSAGDADHTRAVLDRMGTVAFWAVAMRPGRPFAFGTLRAGGGRTVWLFALPGNPVAALVSFYVLARDGLLRLAGAAAEPMPLLQVRAAAAMAKRPGRSEYARGMVFRLPNGQSAVTPAASQGAGVLRSMSESNALIVLHHDQGPVVAGELVDVWLFDGLT